MALFNRKRTADTAVTAPATAAVLDADPGLAALTGDYTIDPAHSSIGFTVRHAMVTNVRGAFGVYEGSLRLDGSEPPAPPPPSTSRSPASTPGSRTATAICAAPTSSTPRPSR